MPVRFGAVPNYTPQDFGKPIMKKPDIPLVYTPAAGFIQEKPYLVGREPLDTFGKEALSFVNSELSSPLGSLVMEESDNSLVVKAQRTEGPQDTVEVTINLANAATSGNTEAAKLEITPETLASEDSMRKAALKLFNLIAFHSRSIQAQYNQNRLAALFGKPTDSN